MLRAFILLLALAGCGDGGPAGPTAVFVLPRTAEDAFFDLPWPSEVRRTADGFVDVSAWPNQRSVDALTVYLGAMRTRLRGYGTSSTSYLRFSEAVDMGTVPATPEASLLDEASVFLMDVDPTSANRAKRHPIEVRFRQNATAYWPATALAVRPVFGLPLAPDRLYAIVVTRAVRPAAGGEFEPDEDLAAILAGAGGDEAVERARPLFDPAISALTDAGLGRADILSITVFRTQDPTGELIAARDWMMEEYPAPDVRDGEWRFVAPEPDDMRDFDLVHGAYGPSPTFQDGTIPYTDGTGGEIHFDEAGDPIVAGEFDARFALAVPRTPMPAPGYPIVLYAHGTGGDFMSFVRDGTAAALTGEGFAVMGVDAVHHGERNITGEDENLTTFNFLNPLAFRDNGRQAALDIVQQARAVPAVVVPARTLPRMEGEVRLDPARIWFFGHSQGGISGPLFLSIDDQTLGGVLSGAGSVLTAGLIDKHEPYDIPMLVALYLGIMDDPADPELTHEHPIVSLLQTWLEPEDNANYVHMMFDRPRAGFAPKTILQTEGTEDPYTPPRAMEALATAAGIPLVEPVRVPVEGLSLRGIRPLAAPASANVAGGDASAGLLQFAGGHFVAFDDDAALPFVRGFFRSIAEGTPSIGQRAD